MVVMLTPPMSLCALAASSSPMIPMHHQAMRRSTVKTVEGQFQDPVDGAFMREQLRSSLREQHRVEFA